MLGKPFATGVSTSIYEIRSTDFCPSLSRAHYSLDENVPIYNYLKHTLSEIRYSNSSFDESL